MPRPRRSGALQVSLGRREFRRSLFPLRGRALELTGDGGKFAVDRDGAAAGLVSSGIFQLGDQFLLLALQGGDVHFQLPHSLLAFAAHLGEFFAHFGFGPALGFLFA